MRIFSVSPVGFNHAQNKNVSFGKFRDENAREKVKEVLTIKDPIQARVMQPVYDSYFERIDKCEYADVYTDENNKISVYYDDEFVKENDIDFLVERSYGHTKDLSTFNDVENLAMDIGSIDNVVNPQPKSPEQLEKERKQKEASDRELREYVEALDQSRLDNLPF